jgi:PBP1b-binding outer membrane lipoprotein LpoB
MKYSVLLLAVLLSGCLSTAPVKQKFPDVPDVLTERCEKLKKIEGDSVAITEMLKVIVKNYALYYECSTKVDGWQEWYNEQKKIYESVK